jgi:hypothetical protein
MSLLLEKLNMPETRARELAHHPLPQVAAAIGKALTTKSVLNPAAWVYSALRDSYDFRNRQTEREARREALLQADTERIRADRERYAQIASMPAEERAAIVAKAYRLAFPQRQLPGFTQAEDAALPGFA